MTKEYNPKTNQQPTPDSTSSHPHNSVDDIVNRLASRGFEGVTNENIVQSLQMARGIGPDSEGTEEDYWELQEIIRPWG